MEFDPLELSVRDAIARDGLLASGGAPVIVGLSGGADSVALLSSLCALGYYCVAVHCNFHLRGDEAMRDQRHAEAVAMAVGVECRVVDFDTKEYMASNGVSLEMACRELRYGYFGRLLEEIGAQAIAVAHHRDDNVETFFLNLLRGTGLRGLRGMLPRQGNVVRPLLGVTRADIEEYLKRKGLTYVTDSSNAVNDVVRNRLRNIVLPAVRSEFPDADRAIAATIDILRQNEIVYDSAISVAAGKYKSDYGDCIALSALVTEQSAAATVLFELLREYGFNASQAADMVRSHDSSGRRFLSGTHEALINRGELLLYRLSDADASVECRITDVADQLQWPVACAIERIGRSAFAPRSGVADTIYMDTRALDGNPEWVVRSWRDGDRLKPFGMSGSRKLSDIFSDAKLSMADKRNIRVLTRNGEIMWVLGMRASRLFAVSDDTTEILKITLLNT